MQQTAAQQTAAEMEESVATTLKIASDWKAKGDVRWELSCVASVIEGLLTIAVTHHDSVRGGRRVPARQARRGAAGAVPRAQHQPAERVPRQSEGSARAAVDHQVSFAHIGWLLGQYALGDAILQIACEHGDREVLAAHEVLDRVPPGDGLPGVTRRRTFRSRRTSSGLREALGGCISVVVEALTTGADPAPALAACADSFTRRNRDKRVTSFPFDGNGRDPVRWEFRLPSILARWNAGA